MLCTEPFRIPLAGRVDTCLFDKTGTITTEHLTLRGLVVPSSNSSSNSGGGWSLVPAQRAPPESQRVLAACHALVEVSV